MGFSLRQAPGTFSLYDDTTGRDAMKFDANDSRSYSSPPAPFMFDDFEGDVIADQWAVNKGSDGATVNFAVLASTANGAVRATTGAGAGGTMAVNGVLLERYLNWKPNAGGLVMQARVKISAITNISLFVGFTDQVGTLEAPINSAASANTITTTATDAVGFFFDTSMTDDYFWIAGVKADTDATHANTNVAPVAATWVVLRVEVDASGNGRFFIDGAYVGAVVNATTATVALTPVVSCFTRTAASATVDVDYVYVKADRA